MKATLLALLDTLLERRDPRTVERVERLLEASSRAVRFGFHVSLLIFDWTAFFFFGFERFSTLPLKVRRRYVRLWTRTGLAPMRHLFLALRTVALSAFFDEREHERAVGYRC